jgi:hypothetical protein
MPDRDLKLNSLPRFLKKSPQLILEEHSHCEVPAGCGGVVLRWRNPNEGIPLQTWVYAAGKFDLALDGEILTSARPIVPWGHHVWSLVITDANPHYALFSFAAFHGGKEMHIKTTGPSVDPVFILSKPEELWKYTHSEQTGNEWMKLDFDDSQWLPLASKEINPTALEKTSRDAYRIRKLQEFGAEALGTPEVSNKFWIRKVFSVERKPSSD